MDSLIGSLSPDIGIDLGSVNTPVLECGRGVTVCEPTFVAYDRENGRVTAVGTRAQQMYERVPERIEVIRPVSEGVIVDYQAAEVFLRHLLRKTVSKGVLGPRIMVGVPVGASNVECRAVSEVLRLSGARVVYVVPQPLAAAVGAGLPVLDARGSMLVDIGGGTSQVAVLAMGGIILSGCQRIGGDRLNEQIIHYMRDKHGLVIGYSSAEKLKVNVCSAVSTETELQAQVCGRDFSSGLPRQVTVTANQLCEVVKGTLEEIGRSIMRVLEGTPPALASDIVEFGCALTGGGSLLRGLDEFLTRMTGITCRVVAEPLLSVAQGTEKMFTEPRLMRSVSSGNGQNLMELR